MRPTNPRGCGCGWVARKAGPRPVVAMRVQEMLAYEPHRIDVKRALQHPYFADLRTTDDGRTRNAQRSGKLQAAAHCATGGGYGCER